MQGLWRYMAGSRQLDSRATQSVEASILVMEKFQVKQVESGTYSHSIHSAPMLVYAGRRKRTPLNHRRTLRPFKYTRVCVCVRERKKAKEALPYQ